MNAKAKRPSISILSVWMLTILLITGSVSAIFTALLVYYRSTDIMEGADARLLMAVEMSREIVGKDFHDRIDGLSSISEDQFAHIVERNDDLCRRLGLQYLWSVLQVNNKLVFTSATHSDVNDPASPCASFFDTHRDPQAFAPALGPEMKPSFSSFNNEWGAGRQVLVPRKDSRGRTYIFGASIQLAEYDAIVKQSLLAALAIWFAVMCVVFPAALAFSHRLLSPIAGLTNAADRLASGDSDATLPSTGVQELQLLSRSFNRMRVELKKQTEELRESEEKYRSMANMLPLIVFQLDRAGNFEFVNKAGFEAFGYAKDDVLGGMLNARHMFVETDLTRVVENLAMVFEKRGRELGWSEYTALRKDGNSFPVSILSDHVEDDKGNVTGLRGVIMDITSSKLAEEERDKLQAQLNQAQKMESIGRLAGGVAHDYNNKLFVIIGYTEMAMRKMASDDPLQKDLKEIYNSAWRSADITRQLLAFARKQTISPKVLNLNETVEGMLKMLRRLIGEDIDLVWLPGKHPDPVRVDPSQIDQILANLCVNARDAIGGVGRITIETDNVRLDEEYCADRPGFKSGGFVMLAVKDDGCGMDKETMDNVFEPFFTTKSVGEGTGLGLATVYGIVKQNNGFIDVHSEPSKGAAFRIYLPRHEGESPRFTVRDETETPLARGETVLIVEDEAPVLKLAKIILDRLGYTVLDAATPSRALVLAEEHAGEISLLITDVVMPEMNGRDLADQLRGICHGLKVLFMSGYTANTIAHRGVLDEGMNFIQKPFSKRDLAVKVREALDEGKGQRRG